MNSTQRFILYLASLAVAGIAVKRLFPTRQATMDLHETIRTQDLQIVDDDGNVVIRLHAPGGPNIALFDNSGANVANIDEHMIRLGQFGRKNSVYLMANVDGGGSLKIEMPSGKIYLHQVGSTPQFFLSGKLKSYALINPDDGFELQAQNADSIIKLTTADSQSPSIQGPMLRLSNGDKEEIVHIK